MWVITLRWLHWYKFVVVLHGGVSVLIAEFCHCLHIKHFICLWLLRKVIYVVICWLLCWQNVSQYISCLLCPQQNQKDYSDSTERWRWYYRFKCLNDAIQQPIDLTVPFLELARFLRPLCVFRVVSQHHHSSDGCQSDTAFADRGHTLTVSPATHEACPGADKQQQQQERHIHRRSSQTCRWLDERDRRGSQSASALSESNQTAETPAGPGSENSTHGSSSTWGIRRIRISFRIWSMTFWGGRLCTTAPFCFRWNAMLVRAGSSCLFPAPWLLL